MPYLQKTESEKHIYQAIVGSAFGRVPCFPTIEEGCERNLYRVLLTDKGSTLLRYAATEERAIFDGASDFENLETLLGQLPSLVGSGYHSFVCCALELLLPGLDPSKMTADALWEASLPWFADGKSGEMSLPFRALRAADLTELILPSAAIFDGVSSLNEYKDRLSVMISECDAVSLDASELVFRSPDPYHAEEGFRAVTMGNADEKKRSYLSSQLLRFLGELAVKYGRPLLLSGEPTESLGQAVSYLKKNDRLPRLFYCIRFDGGGAVGRRYRELLRLGLLEELSGVIPTDIPYGSTATLSESLSASLTNYPLGKHCFLAEGETPIELRVGYERFLRILSRLLGETVSLCECTEEQAVAVGTQVLCGGTLF